METPGDPKSLQGKTDKSNHSLKSGKCFVEQTTWRWTLGLIYIIAVAAIWIAASYIVQSVVDSGVSPFLITYICNSLFIIYIPIVEVSRYLEDSGYLCRWFKSKNDEHKDQFGDMENVNLLHEGDHNAEIHVAVIQVEENNGSVVDNGQMDSDSSIGRFDKHKQKMVIGGSDGLDAKGRWTHARMAKVSLLICPFWFFAQLTFNLSLKYTTVTSNTILSTTSSLFTFLVALVFLGERFTWVKLSSVLLCMAGTIIVSLADSDSPTNAIATNPLLGDFFSLFSAGLYAIYITLIRKMLPDETKGEGQASTAQFLGFLGLFNMLIFLPIALVLNFTKLEPFHKLNWEQVGLIVGKGLLDNVLSDFLWAEAILLTTTIVATAGLTIQVPIAALVDTLTGHPPHLMNYIGAAAVMIGFAGINIPTDDSKRIAVTELAHEAKNVTEVESHLELPSETI